MINNNRSFILLTIILVISFCLTNVFANADSAVGSHVKYKTVQVKSGDSLWSIAGRTVTNREDIRDTIAVISKINQLDRNAQIYPGQTLKIPISE